MAIAVFASKTFEISSKKIYTFNDFSINGNLETEKQDISGKKPSTYIKGPDLQEMSFNIPLDTSLGVNVRMEYESWVSIKDAGVAYPFILGGKPIGNNKWLLKSVSLSDTKIDSKGNILFGTLQLQFEEYVRPGSIQKSSLKTTSKSKSSAPAVKIKADKSTSQLLAGNKAANKRNNQNATVAVAKGKIKNMRLELEV